MDGHPTTNGWSPTNPRMVTHQKEVYYRLGNNTLLTKLTPGDNHYGRSPTIPWRVSCQHEDGHPPTQE